MKTEPQTQVITISPGELAMTSYLYGKMPILVPTFEIEENEIQSIVNIVNKEMIKYAKIDDFDIIIFKRLTDPVQYGVVSILNIEVGYDNVVASVWCRIHQFDSGPIKDAVSALPLINPEMIKVDPKIDKIFTEFLTSKKQEEGEFGFGGDWWKNNETNS